MIFSNKTLFKQKSIIPDCIHTRVHVRDAPSAADQLKERRKLMRQLRRDADKSTFVSEHRVHRRFDLSFDLLTLSLFGHRLASRSQADCRNPNNPFMVAAPQRESRNMNTVGFKGIIITLITSDYLCHLLLAKQTVDLFCNCFVLFFEFAY